MPKKLWVVLILGIFIAIDELYNLLDALPMVGDIFRNLRSKQPVPYFVSEWISVIQVILVLLVLMLLHRYGVKKAFQEIGLSKPFAPAFSFALVATLPLWLVFAVTMPFDAELSLNTVLYLSLVSPLAEEVLYRGFAFGQIRRRAGWGFWPTALLIAVIFGLAHLGLNQDIEQAVAVFLITGIGGGIFSWVYEKWDYNLWAPISIHFLMNLAWNLFNVGESAYAGWLPTMMQVSAVVMIILLIKNKHRIAFFAQ